MAGGRPTDYKENTCQKAQEYLDQCIDVRSDAGGLTVNLPSVAGLARHLNVARSTIYSWRDLHPEFLDILEQILAEQEKRLMENGLAGTYHASIAKLALGKHGYTDEQHLTHEVGETLADLMTEVNEPKRKSKKKVQG